MIGIEAYPKQFDPRLTTDAITQRMNALVFEGLLERDDNLKLVPRLASSYEIKNKTTYIFKLKPNITFHDGSPLTSQDVKDTYLSMMDDNFRSAYKSSLSRIQKIETPDDYTVIIHTKEVYSPILTLMSLAILPSEQIAKKDFKTFSGTGPYQYNYNSFTASKTILDKNQNYHGEKSKNNHLVFRVIQDPTLRVLELMKGRVDLLQSNVPPVLAPKLKADPNIQFKSIPGITFSYMAFQFNNKYLQNKNVREAIALAIPRENIIQYKFKNLASLATTILSPKHEFYNPNLNSFSQNLERAKTLLDEAGFKDPDGDGPEPRFTLVYKTSADKLRVEIAELISENLKKIGIEAKVVSNEFGTFYQDIRQGDFDLYTLSWVGVTDADIYYYAFHSQAIPPKGANRGFYINPKLDPLLDSYRLTTDELDQKKIQHQIQSLVASDFVYAPLWYEDTVVFMRDIIKGYEPRANGSYWGLVEAHK